MNEGTCAIRTCDKKARCRGWCSAHYERWRKHGDPTVTLPPVPPPAPIRTQPARCVVDGCERTPWARSMCSAHYSKARQYGDPTVDRRRLRLDCSVSDCSRPVRGHGWCPMHYQRWRAHGDVEARPSLRFTACQVPDCQRPLRSATSGLCHMHYTRRWRHGSVDVLRVPTRSDQITYRAAHQRITTDRGPARVQPCVDCGSRAHHWSYMHTDPGEMRSPGGQPFSLDPAHYEPRCASCHARFDDRYSV